MVSIIIPIYNVVEYLQLCIDTVLAQSFNDWECILVDDGSTDGSAEICDSSATKDSRIKVIHKSNEGLSDARNVGLKEAIGDWIFFLDSDDWIHPQALETLYVFATTHHCEVVQGNFYYAYPNHLLYRAPKKQESSNHVYTKEEAMRLLIINDRVKNFAWGKLYRTDLIRDLFFPVGKFFEDSFWQHLVMDRVIHYGIIDEPLYYYRQREDSISGTISNRLLDLVEGYGERLEFIKENYPHLTPLMKKKCKMINDMVFPRRGLIPWLEILMSRIKERLFPSVKYIRIDL